MTRLPRRRILAGLAGLSAAVVAACARQAEPSPVTPPTTPGPTPTAEGPTASPTPSPSASTSKLKKVKQAAPDSVISVRGVDGGLADLAMNLYVGGDVATTSDTEALKKRKPPKKAVTVTGSQGEWDGTPVGVLGQGKDRTFAVYRDKKWQVVAGWWPGLGIEKVHASGKQFVLIMGSDAREDEGQAVNRSRADTLQIVGVDGKGGAGILGIPRDSWSSVGKINAGLVFGGPEGQTEAIASLTGLPVDRYVLTGFLGFRKFVKELGGVTVNSPHALPSRGIGKGKVHLNDKDAMWFARERKDLPNGDFGRSANQQRLLVAFALALKAMGPAKFGRMVTVLDKETETNLSAEDAMNFAAWAWSIKTSTLVTKVATGGFGMRNGQSVVLLGSAAQEMFNDFEDGNLS